MSSKVWGSILYFAFPRSWHKEWSFNQSLKFFFKRQRKLSASSPDYDKQYSSWNASVNAID